MRTILSFICFLLGIVLFLNYLDPNFIKEEVGQDPPSSSLEYGNNPPFAPSVQPSPVPHVEPPPSGLMDQYGISPVDPGPTYSNQSPVSAPTVKEIVLIQHTQGLYIVWTDGTQEEFPANSQSTPVGNYSARKFSESMRDPIDGSVVEIPVLRINDIKITTPEGATGFLAIHPAGDDNNIYRESLGCTLVQYRAMERLRELVNSGNIIVGGDNATPIIVRP